MNFKTIVITFVLFTINLLGLAIWKFNSRSPNDGMVRVTRSRLAICTSCIIFILVMYCLVTVLSISIPGMNELNVSEVSKIFDFLTRTITYIQMPVVIFPVWWYCRSWKRAYETVAETEWIFKNRIYKNLDIGFMVNQITERLLPMLLLYVIFIIIYIWSYMKVLHMGDGIGLAWEIVYASISSKVYVCACVLHLTIALKFVSCLLFKIDNILSEL